MKNTIKHQKHLEACKKWRDNNREKYREVSLKSINKKKDEDIEKYRIMKKERAKKYREKNLEENRKKEREKSRLYRLNNREKYLQKSREYRKNNPEKFRKYYEKSRMNGKYYIKYRNSLLKSYGLNQEIYDQILLKQEGKCAICKISFKNEKPCIDHNHETGKVRGLLCGPCNIILGFIEKKNKENGLFINHFTEYLK